MSFFSKVKSIRSSTAAFVFGTWLTTSLMTIIFRAIRVFRRGRIKEVILGIDVYKSDIFFLMGGLLLGLFTLYLIRNRKKLKIFFVTIAIFIGLIITGIEAIAFRFFGATGSTIDFSLMYYTLQNFEETREVLASEVPTGLMIALGFLIILYVILPFLVYLAWKKWVHKEEKLRTPKYALFTGTLGLLFLGLGFFPPFKDPSPAFAKNATLQVASTAIEVATQSTEVSTTADFDTSKVHLSGSSKTNVVFILLESTRASATSHLNPELNTTPFFEELTKNSLIATRGYTLVPHTSKALTASLCGIPPSLRMPITEASNDGIPGRCLAKLLRKEGYQTSFFQSATKRFEGRTGLVKNMGYKDFYPSETFSTKGFEKANYFGREDNIMLEPSRKWLKENKSKGPVFMTYLTLTPHHNYDAPKRYGRHDYAEDKQFNRYLNTVHYVDQFTKNVVQMFKDEGIYEDTVFVIYGDHGEGFSEHGRRQHDNVIWEEGTHIPIIIHKAGAFPGGKKITEIVNQLDLIPTVLPLLGFTPKNAKYPGNNMLELPKNRTLFSYCWYDRRCMAIRKGDEKYIYHFGQLKDEFFNVIKDPNEKKNLISELKNASSWKHEGIAWRRGVNQVYQEHYRSRLGKFVSKTRPKVTHQLDYNFEDYTKLIGYDIDDNGPYTPGKKVEITLHWEVLKDLPDGFKLFVHGHGKGVKRKNFDHIPVDGFVPVDEWKTGDFISDVDTYKISKKAKDDYILSIGLYKKKPARRLKVGDKTSIDIVLKMIPVIETAPKEPVKIKPTMLQPKMIPVLDPKLLNIPQGKKKK